MVFDSTRSGNRDIWLKNVATGATTQVTSSSHADEFPSWSPDGKEVAFQSNRSGNMDIWIKDLASGVTSQLTTYRFADQLPAWSPDGTKIVFSRAESAGALGGIHNLWTINVNTRALTKVASATKGLGFGISSWQPT